MRTGRPKKIRDMEKLIFAEHHTIADELRSVAENQGKSMSQIIREAVDQYLQTLKTGGKQ